MADKLPRIDRARADGPATISLRWRGDTGETVVNLAGWIATGGDTLARLTDATVFATVRVGDYGASLEWGENGDLAIDAGHLKMLADELRPFTSDANEAGRGQP